MSPAAAEMLARSARGSPAPSSADVHGISIGTPVKRQESQAAAAHSFPIVDTGEQLLQSLSVSADVREFYMAVQREQMLPHTQTPLGERMKTLRKRFSRQVNRRPLHVDEVRLLALLHDAGLPVLGKNAVGQVVSRDSSA